MTAAGCVFTDVPGVKEAILLQLAKLGLKALLEAAITALLAVFGLGVLKFIYNLFKLIYDGWKIY